jgi:hypothetical protein
MITASNKLWATAGAFALAATAVLVPVAAQADPAGDTDSSSASSDASSASSDVGSAAGRKAGRTNRGGTRSATNDAAGTGVSTPPESVVSGARDATGAPAANNTGSNPLFQNPLWWFGTPNPTPPPAVASRNFDALSSLPGWARSYYGWYENLNFEACVLGLSSTIQPNIGPYGNSTSSISTGGC